MPYKSLPPNKPQVPGHSGNPEIIPPYVYKGFPKGVHSCTDTQTLPNGRVVPKRKIVQTATELYELCQTGSWSLRPGGSPIEWEDPDEADAKEEVEPEAEPTLQLTPQVEATDTLPTPPPPPPKPPTVKKAKRKVAKKKRTLVKPPGAGET